MNYYKLQEGQVGLFETKLLYDDIQVCVPGQYIYSARIKVRMRPHQLNGPYSLSKRGKRSQKTLLSQFPDRASLNL